MPDETPTVAPATTERLRWLASWLESGDCGHAGDGDVAPLRALADALEAITREELDALEQATTMRARALAVKLAALLPPEG